MARTGVQLWRQNQRWLYILAWFLSYKISTNFSFAGKGVHRVAGGGGEVVGNVSCEGVEGGIVGEGDMGGQDGEGMLGE